MVVQDAQFAGILEAIGRQDLLDDERFASLGVRFAHMDELAELLAEEFRRWPTADLIEGARERGAPFAPVNDLDQFLADPQVAHSEIVRDIDDPDVRVRTLRPPARLSATPSGIRRRPPRLGEHTDEILGIAGFDAAGIASLRESGVVA